MTGAILAGGRSQRMGRDKGLLSVGGRTLIKVALDVIGPLFPHVLIVANDPVAYGGFGVPVERDRFPDRGPLGGIHAALSASRTDHTFCLACDMPLANPAVIANLCALAPGYDVVVPVTTAGFEPLHAVYGRSCLPHLERMFRDGRLRVDALFSAVRTQRVEADALRPLDPTLRSFFNVNTPADLATAREILDRGGETPCDS
jgi:molybdopterin-guanine dinucleotide biosynthesis protein A